MEYYRYGKTVLLIKPKGCVRWIFNLVTAKPDDPERRHYLLCYSLMKIYTKL